MKHGSSIVIVLLLSTAAALSGQEYLLTVDGGPAWKGLSVRFVTRLEPATPGTPFEGSVIDSGVYGNAQRFIDDAAHRRSFGYELQLEPSADATTAQLRIMPLHDAKHAVDNGWSQFGLPAGLPKYPAIPGLRVGDTVALDLLVNPATGQKIVDYLTLVKGRSPQPVHDFSLNDIELSLDRPRILSGGSVLKDDFSGGASGNVVWIYLPGRGRFVLSLFPNPKLGFQKSGTVAGNLLTFHDGATELRLECKSPVAPGDGPYNLYVLRDPAWHPKGAGTAILTGAAGSADFRSRE